MANWDKLLDSDLFAEFRKHRDAFEINLYLGDETVENCLAPYLTDAGALCAPDALDEMLNLVDDESRIKYYVSQVISGIDTRIRDKWITELPREQAEIVCRAVGYDNWVVVAGTKISVTYLGYHWHNYHSGERCLSVCREWDGE